MTSRRQAKRALELHADALAAYPNVVALGTVVSGDVDRPTSEREHAVAVYVTEKLPVRQLAPDAVLPVVVEIPGRDGIRKVGVEVIEVGEIGPEQDENRDTGGSTASTFGPE